MKLLRTVVSWIGRHALLLLIVVLAIVALQHTGRAVGEFDSARSSLASLESIRADVQAAWEAGRKDAETRARELEAAANNKIEQRIADIDRDLVQISDAPMSPIRVNLGGLGVNAEALKALAVSNARKQLLLRERDFLRTLLVARNRLTDYERMLLDARNELERRRRVHAQAYEAYLRNEEAQRDLIAHDRFQLHRIAYTPAYKKLRQLRAENMALRKEVIEAHEAYGAQERIIGLMRAPGSLGPFKIESDPPDDVTALLVDEQTRVQESLKDNWLGRMIATLRDDTTRALPMAAAIVLGIILTPVVRQNKHAKYPLVLSRIFEGLQAWPTQEKVANCWSIVRRAWHVRTTKIQTTSIAEFGPSAGSRSR